MKYLTRSLPRCLPVLAGLALATSLAHAQAGPVFVYFGGGAAHDSSAGTSIDTFGNGTLYNTPNLNGFFLDFGGGLMITDHLGAAAEVSWRASQGNYAGLKYKPVFYDFDGIWQPVKVGRIAPELRAGIGGVSLRYYYNQQYCDQFAGCSSSNQFLESSKHFQIHLAAALRIRATEHIFIRPAFDVHYVNNFYQFGSNWVPQYSVSVGYAFGASQ